MEVQSLERIVKYYIPIISLIYIFFYNYGSLSEVVLVRAAKVSNAIESEAAIAVDVIYAFRTSPVRTISILLPNQSPKEV